MPNFSTTVDAFTPAWQAGWSRLTLPDAPSARWGHSLTQLDDDLLVVGGELTNLSPSARSAQIWSLQLGSGWRRLAAGSKTPPARRQHAAARYGGDVAVTGGLGLNGATHGDIWSVRPSSAGYTATLHLEHVALARYGHALVAMDGGLLLFGGRVAHRLFDDVVAATGGGGGGELDRARAVVEGGDAGLALNDLWLLVPEQRLVRRLGAAALDVACEDGAVPCARSDHALLRYGGASAGAASGCGPLGCVVVHGGRSNLGAALADVWLWRPRGASLRALADGDAGRWARLRPAMGSATPPPCVSCACALAGDGLYAFGAAGGAPPATLGHALTPLGRTAALYRLELRTLRWAELRMPARAAAPEPAGGAAMVVADGGGSLVVVGGSAGGRRDVVETWRFALGAACAACEAGEVCDAPTGACVCASEHCGRGAPPYVSPPLVDAEAWGLLLKATALIALSAFGSYTGSALTEAARRVVQYR